MSKGGAEMLERVPPGVLQRLGRRTGLTPLGFGLRLVFAGGTAAFLGSLLLLVSFSDPEIVVNPGARPQALYSA